MELRRKYKKAVKKVAPKKKAAPKRVAKKVAKKSVTKKAAAYKYPHPLKTGKKANFVIKRGIVYNGALIKGAEFVRENTLLVRFTDGFSREIDFSGFLNAKSTPQYLREYKKESKFKNFRIKNGNLVWGRDWDLIFPVTQLYNGKISLGSVCT